MSSQRVNLTTATPSQAGRISTIKLVSQSVTGPAGADGSSMSAAAILAALLTVDGAGSGLDADLLDGNSSTAFATAAQGSTADTAVQPARSISTTAPLTGGGDLSANRTLAVSAASDTASGVVELATSAETITGTDATRAVTPAGVAAAAAMIGLGGGEPGELTGVAVAAESTTPRIVEYIDGVAWGTKSDATIWQSTDNGATWTSVATGPTAAQRIYRIIVCDDGEVLIGYGATIYKSSGWATNPATVTWSAKVTANSPAYFLPWGIDGNGTKFIATEYAAVPDWASSNNAWISTDGGDTWSVVWDQATRFPGDAALSHCHAACYDPWSDWFYLSEGHSTSKGVYVSADNGGAWTLVADSAIDGAPTVIVATDRGVVLGTDSDPCGVYAIDRRSTIAELSMRLLWRWESGTAGIVGFAQRGFRDPTTGIVYIGFNSSFAAVKPVLVASDGGSAGLLWEATTAEADGRIWNQVVTSTGKLIGHYTTGSVESILTGYVTPPTNSSKRLNAGNVAGASAVPATSVAVGYGASAPSTAVESVVIGQGASVSSNGQAVVIGQGSTGPATCVVVGEGSTASAAGQTVIGQGITTANGQLAVVIGQGASSGNANNTRAVVIGAGAGNGAASTAEDSVTIGGQATGHANGVAIGASSTIGSNSTAIGKSAAASGVLAVAVGVSATASSTYNVAVGNTASSATGTKSVAIGYGASTVASNAVAIGQSASVPTGLTGSVALGSATTATAANQVEVGAKHIEFSELAADPAAGAANSARLYAKDDGAGTTQLAVRFATGPVVVLGPSPEFTTIALSDETTAITTGTAKVTWRAPMAMTLTAVRASLTTASSSGTPTVDINEGGTSILSTKLTIDANELTSTTAATAAVISDASIADDAELTFDIDTAGTGAKGLKVTLYWTRA